MSLDLPDPVDVAIPGFIVLVSLEIVFVRFQRRREASLPAAPTFPPRAAGYEVRDTAASLVMGFGSTLAGALFGGGLVLIAGWIAPHRLLPIGPTIGAFAALFLLEDLCYYAFHRLSHERRLWWASHVNHHSSQHYNLSTALRQTWTGSLALTWTTWLPLAWIGFPIELILFQKSLNLVYQFWIHTEAIGRLPRPLEAIFNTPSHHRVHHARNPRYLDANYAGTLIIWDRLFGTFIAERADDPPRYGLSKNLGTFNPLKIAFHEWLALGRDVWAAPWKSKLGYVFGPPGWSHDGSRLTSKQLRERWATEQPK